MKSKMNYQRKQGLLFRVLVVVMAVVIAIPAFGTEAVYAASKKVGKVYGCTAYVINGKPYAFDDKSDLSWTDAAKAKKYQIYRAKSIKGKYKKVMT